MKVNKTNFVLLMIAVFCIVSCQSRGVRISDSPMSLSDTRRIITKVIGHPRELSENGREMYSAFSDGKGKISDGAAFANERKFTKVTILGDRRPYDIVVEVILEKKVSLGLYKYLQHDDERARLLAERIKQELHESRSRSNVIDDFQPL